MPFPALIVPSAALIIPLPAQIFPNKLKPSVAANVPKSPLFSFTSLSTVSVTPFINQPESSRDLIIFYDII